MARTNQPDANTIIQRLVEALRADWEATPQYNYSEREVEGHRIKTYQVMMILGSPYKRLVAMNGTQLLPEDQKKEQRKLDHAITQRRTESKEKTEERIADYKKERRRDHRMIEELTKAFGFKLSGETMVDAHQVYVLEATPLPGYQPPDRETEVLTACKANSGLTRIRFSG